MQFRQLTARKRIRICAGQCVRGTLASMFRALPLLVLLCTAADAVGAGRYAVCPMQTPSASEAPGCGHCPPAAAPAVRDGLPDCCALHASVRPAPAPAEPAGSVVRYGPGVAIVPVALAPPATEPWRVATRRLAARSTAPPTARNLPLLR